MSKTKKAIVVMLVLFASVIVFAICGLYYLTLEMEWGPAWETHQQELRACKGTPDVSKCVAEMDYKRNHPPLIPPAP